MIELITLAFNLWDTLRSLAVALIYGVMENRLFQQDPEKQWIFGKFTTYHLFMFGLFFAVAFNFNPIQLAFNMIMMAFAEDAFWHVIQGKPLAQSDWSNLGGKPLVCGIYLWYIVASVILLGLGITMLIV
jgi:hypothetical protein